MKLYTTLLFLLAAINISAQTLYENFGQRVFLNKKIISYTIYQKKIKNGIADEGKMNNPNENNPYNISISSNENSASIRVNNKSLREDLFYNFEKIYKLDEGENITYNFINNSKCNASLWIPKNNDHQTLIIDCKDSNKNGYLLMFTISKLDQL